MKKDESVQSAILAEVELLRARVLELERREQEREDLEASLNECLLLATLTRQVSVALIQESTLQESLKRCAHVLVTHLGAAFARVWTLNSRTQMLELQASAGMYTHLNGAHSRIRVGDFKIGRIAAQKLPHLTNQVSDDPQVSDQQWAAREGIVSFAGYPLLVEGELVGVIALFARTPLSPAVLDAMASVSNIVAISIERKRFEEERTRALELAQQAATQAESARSRVERILDNLPDGFIIFDEQWRYNYINPQAEPYTGKPPQDLLGKKVWDEFPELVGSLYDQQYHYAVLHQQSVAFELFAPTLARWFDIHAYPIPDGLAVYFRNITERKQAEEEQIRFLDLAKQARQEAEVALQTRNDFLSSVSHDLKTPIAVMRGNVQLLQRRIKREGMADPIWVTDRLAVIESATMKMNAMVEELLDVAKLQAGQQLDLDMRPVSLVSLIRQINVEQQETTRRHQIVVTTPTEDILVRGDRIRLDRVLANLLANAIKYSPAGGRILVEVTQEEVQGRQWVVVSIHDQGIGIPLADQAHIFDPFYRAGNVLGRMQGTGVGLASTAQILAQHGGEISVRSEEERGSTFAIRLPLLNAEA